MSISTLALGGGKPLGIGLRQGLETQDPDIININTFNGLNVIFYSPSNEQVANLTAGRGQGEKLEMKVRFNKYGNLKNFNIMMLRNSEIPFFNGMKVTVYYNNLAFLYGYIDSIPPTDQNNSVVELTGTGYQTKLKDQKISVDYTNTTVKNILDDIGDTYFLDLGFNYNPSKIQPANVNISSVDWNEKDLTTIIEDLIKICNTNFNTVEYIYGIDQFGDFYFKGISEDEIQEALFEGFRYQSPNVDIDASNLVNRVQLYRTQSASEKETEYVNTFSDSDSIDQYGLYERKLTFSDFIDNTTAENAANGVIADLKDPKTRITVNNLTIDNVLEYGYYSINNKKQDQKSVVSEFALSSDWTQNLTTSTINIIDTNVYTGRLCYQWNIDNSEDDNITKEVEYYFPTKLRIFVRQDVTGEYLSLSVSGTKRRLLNTLITDDSKEIVTDDDTPISAFIEDSTVNDSVNINVPFSNDWTAIDLDLTGWIKITNVTITVIDSSDVTILLDRLEIFNNAYIQRKLSLEDITYNMGLNSIKCESATFGTTKILLTDELKKIDDKNKTAVEIFSKQ